MSLPGVRRVAHAVRRAGVALANPSLASNLRVRLNVLTNRTWALPILLYAPTSRCNSRCVSCDFWRTDGATDLRRDEVAALARALPQLHTKLVVFTGGEPLVRDDVFELADLFRDLRTRAGLVLPVEPDAGDLLPYPLRRRSSNVSRR